MTYCEAHLSRTGEKVPVYKADLCFACWSGNPIDPSVELGGGPAYSVYQQRWYMQNRAEIKRKYRARRMAEKKEKVYSGI